MLVTLIDSNNVNSKLAGKEHISFMFYIDKVSRALLQEISRHRTLNLTVKSSRYTLNKDLKDESSFVSDLGGLFTEYDYESAKKYIYLTNDNVVNETLINQLEALRRLVKTGKSNDVIKYVIPECLYTKLTLSVSYNDLIHLSKLRLHKSALKEFRDLMVAIIGVIPHKLQEEFIELKNTLYIDK